MELPNGTERTRLVPALASSLNVSTRASSEARSNGSARDGVGTDTLAQAAPDWSCGALGAAGVCDAAKPRSMPNFVSHQVGSCVPTLSCVEPSMLSLRLSTFSQSAQ